MEARSCLSCLIREQGVSCAVTEDPPLQNPSQFMLTPTLLGALLLSIQYKTLMGIDQTLTRDHTLSSRVRVWPARLYRKGLHGNQTNSRLSRTPIRCQFIPMRRNSMVEYLQTLIITCTVGAGLCDSQMREENDFPDTPRGCWTRLRTCTELRVTCHARIVFHSNSIRGAVWEDHVSP